MSMFHRLELYGEDKGEKFVEVSFDTMARGFWRCRCIDGDFVEINNEPSFHTLKKDEQSRIKQILTIVYYFTHDEIVEL